MLKLRKLIANSLWWVITKIDPRHQELTDEVARKQLELASLNFKLNKDGI